MLEKSSREMNQIMSAVRTFFSSVVHYTYHKKKMMKRILCETSFRLSVQMTFQSSRENDDNLNF